MENKITVGELIEQLDRFPSNANLYFSGLTFNRLKQRGDDLVQIEFTQTLIIPPGNDNEIIGPVKSIEIYQDPFAEEVK